MVEPAETERQKHDRLLEVLEALASLKFERDRLVTDLKIAIGSAGGLEGIATWNSYTGHELDHDALRADYPDLYETYWREAPKRRFDLL